MSIENGFIAGKCAKNSVESEALNWWTVMRRAAVSCGSNHGGGWDIEWKDLKILLGHTGFICLCRHRKCAHQGNFFCGSVLQSIGVMTITILRVSRMYLIWSLEEAVATKTWTMQERNWNFQLTAGMFIVPNEAKPEIPVVDEGMNHVWWSFRTSYATWRSFCNLWSINLLAVLDSLFKAAHNLSLKPLIERERETE